MLIERLVFEKWTDLMMRKACVRALITWAPLGGLGFAGGRRSEILLQVGGFAGCSGLLWRSGVLLGALHSAGGRGLSWRSWVSPVSRLTIRRLRDRRPTSTIKCQLVISIAHIEKYSLTLGMN